MKTNLVLVRSCACVCALLWAMLVAGCGKDKPNPTPEPEKPVAEYDPAFVVGEFPYLKMGDVKGAEAFEAQLGKRKKEEVKKLGEVYWGDTPRYFKGTKYANHVVAGLLTIPLVKVDAEFVEMMRQASFDDYGMNMIQDAQGNLSPCRIFWSKKYKMEARLFDIHVKALPLAKSVVEFQPQEDEPKKPEEPEPDPTVILTQVKDMPDLAILKTEYATYPREAIEKLETAQGLRAWDEDGSSDETLYFKTLESKAGDTNLKSAIYFYDASTHKITDIILDCKAVTKEEDLAHPDLKKWFEANGFAFKQEKNAAKGKGLVFVNATAKVEAYLYLKSSNNVCFIELHLL